MQKLKPISLLIVLHVLLLVAAVALLVKQRAQPATGKEKIAVITIDGIISGDHGSLAHGVSVDSIVDAVQDYRDDDTVKALVLRIDSPGGSVGAVQEIYEALKKFKAKGKFIVSSFGDVSASGGYYVASLSDKIVCHPGTLTGSIGVIMELPNAEGLLGKIGVSMNTIKSGAMKDSGSPFRRMTESERAYFTSVIMDAYGQFYSAVKEGRKLKDEQLRPLADGRVFSGRMAVQNKLVDHLGDLEDAINTAKKLAGLENKNPEIFYHEEPLSLQKILDMVSATPVKELTALATRQKVRLMYVLQ